jgi:hypothetical protein
MVRNMKTKKSKLFRPFLLEGWMFIISSILLFLYILFVGIMVNNIKTFICLIPLVFISILLYFCGLRDLSKSKDNSYNYYIRKTRMSVKLISLSLIVFVLFITAKYAPEDNRTNEVIIANAQIINYSSFKKEVVDENHYIVLINDNIRISCSKNVYDTINTEKTVKYGYRIKYRWDFFSPQKYYLVDIKKIKIESQSEMSPQTS